MRGRKKATPQMQYEKVWPERVCPVCGKRFLMRVRPDEWGYGSRDGMFKTTEKNTLVLFCSRPCMDEYTLRCVKHRAESLRETTGFKVWWMYDQEFMELPEIAERLGITESGAQSMRDDLELWHWKELDYILTTA